MIETFVGMDVVMGVLNVKFASTLCVVQTALISAICTFLIHIQCHLAREVLTK